MISILSLLILVSADFDEQELAADIRAVCYFELKGNRCCAQCIDIDRPKCGTLGLCGHVFETSRCMVSPVGWETTCQQPKRGLMKCKDDRGDPFTTFYRCNLMP